VLQVLERLHATSMCGVVRKIGALVVLPATCALNAANTALVAISLQIKACLNQPLRVHMCIVKPALVAAKFDTL
jgi:hypothetical protein